MTLRFERIAFVASEAEPAQAALARLTERYPNVPPDEADVVVALGGDGFMLQTLHAVMSRGTPIYGMHRGTIGFLMNDFVEDDLIERLDAACETLIHPLSMEAIDARGTTHLASAINEVSLFRQTYQAAKIRISVDGKVRMNELVADGALVATPAGSTAYNLSAHGPILPLAAPLFALTPLSAFRPRRWRGALLPDRVEVAFDVLEPVKRPVAAVADHLEFRDIHRVCVRLDRDRRMIMLHDPDHGLEERIIAEQFDY
jgi:NAD+ kinase